MNMATVKPTVVPTVYSLRAILGSIVMLALFVALVCLYNAYGSLSAARERLGESVPTRIEMPLYSVTLPDGWAEYSVSGDSLTVFRNSGEAVPALHISAQRDPAFSYHALDMNPTVVLRRIHSSITEAQIEDVPPRAVFEVVGLELLTVKPGVNAVRMLFDDEEREGESRIFYSGDVRYVMWEVHEDADTAAASEAGDFFRHLFERFDMPQMREQIDRPVVNSGELTADINAATHLKLGRELALWRLFAARAETEPDAALLPALQHYREVLRLLSSIREERTALDSEDFARYQTLLRKRRRDVAEWFVVLDKAVSMRDWAKARSQAQWIMRHATLTGEKMDARRAADILATKIPAESGN